MAKYRWILVWDADFVLQDGAASMIKELLGSLDERKYYLIYWPHIFLDGDLQHQNPKILFTLSIGSPHGALSCAMRKWVFLIALLLP
jgi:hypothetical protein